MSYIIEVVANVISSIKVGDVAGNITTASIFFASAVVVNAIYNLLASAFKHVQYEKALRKAEFDKAINSYKIDTLGSYLHNTLGKVSVYEYAKEDEKADQLHKYLSRIADMLSADDDLEKSDVAVSAYPQDGIADDLPSNLRLALNEIRIGEVWNGLARMRRDLEINLNELAEKNNLPIGKSSAGSMLHYLGRVGLVNGSILEQLRWALSVANRAIHGIDVSRSDAEEAFWVVASAYKSLDWK
ncbi:hypothetical protein [Azospirillum soli]|uniref:hypothetical protein n=1 Tax=Azospirillum soli TaxID=1304799 RepID=UPI001AEA92F6|nr:hypothetical protein [Azospirillum soli]MBP2312992.1 hypothetical protein [Azospirillum soli]